jgi:alpha-amylase/alpha-mannosidase (GH57 family)
MGRVRPTIPDATRGGTVLVTNRRFALWAAAALALACVAPHVARAADATPPTIADGGVRFAFSAPDASSVHLAGEFNGWDPAALPMSDDDGDGVWEVVTELQAGRTYEYKFVVDGGVAWREDPLNPHTVDDNHGGVNTVVSVDSDGSVVLGPLAADLGPAEPVVDELPSLGTPLSVAIVWHQHQPKYFRDAETGEYMDPWVRMHAIKDYYDMVAILAEFPEIHFTVNLTPVLLTQLDDIIAGYENGTGTDAYLRMTLKDAAELTAEDQVYLLTHFFNAHWDNMIHVWPRYGELKGKKGGDTQVQLLAAAARFTEQDWRDLQAWFNLAWFDPDFQKGDVTLPDGTVGSVKALIEKERGYTEADKREIIEAQMAIARNVVAVHKEMQDRGQLEVITTPFYHPILPLVYDTDLARVASPGIRLPEHRFSYPDDARRHVELAVEYYEGLFGRRPAGMWPGEGAVAQEIVGMVADAGFEWIASDDQILERSLGAGRLSSRQRYQMYWAGAGDARVAAIFRDHRLSDDIGFNFGKMDGVDAANSMMRSLHAIHQELAGDERSYVVPIILDGENAWEWFRHDGKEFFRSWYDQMSRASFLGTVTVSEYLAQHPPTKSIERLWAGSWIGHDLTTWIGEPEENLAWDYLAAVRADLEDCRTKGDADDDAIARAFGEILAAEGSDWFWWYGNDQTSSLEGGFDESFRGMLANVYTEIGKEPPSFLSESILGAGEGTAPGATGAGAGVMARAEGEGGLLAGPARVEGGYLFSVKEPEAGSVHLAGGFNDWSTDATPMEDEDGDGVWTVVIELAPGRYEYKFVVDGGARWIEDPGNPEGVADPYGGRNSLIVVE